METVPKTTSDNTGVTITLLCELVAFLIASVVKTEEEWKHWGEPFLQRMYEAQFGEEDGQCRLQAMQAKFYPLIGHGIAVWLEDLLETSENMEGNHEDAEYLMISSVEERFVKVLQPYFASLGDNDSTARGTAADTENVLFQAILQEFLQKLILYQASHHLYDARGRTIAKKVCHLLHQSALEMSIHEQQQSCQHNNNNNKVNFLHNFHQHASQIPRHSLVVSYKLWRVAFIAAGGGAMVGMASFAAAPTLMATIVPILTSAVNVMQVSIAMETFLSYVGLVSYSVLPTAFSTYGASVASQRMLKRYGEIKQFELLPLHISSSAPMVSAASTVKHLPTVTSGGSSAPIYILVCGHMEKNIDPRALWGANGTVLLLDEEDVHDVEVGADTAIAVNGGEGAAEELVGSSSKPPSPVRRQVSKAELQFEIDAEVQALAARMKDNIKHVVEHNNNNQTEQQDEEDEEAESVSDDWTELQVKHQGWWRDMVPHGEEYILLWETDVLSSLNESFIQMLKDSIYSKIYGKFQESLWKLTPIYPIKQAISLPKWALGKLKELDDAWVVAMDRAQQAGKLLAKTLLAQKQQSQQQGQASRSINLIGYGMGARVIFHCLEQLAMEGQEAGKGIVENVVLMGAPVGTGYQAWYQARLMVANRFVNAYSRFDWLLALLYRSRSLEFGVAGLYPVHISTTAAANDVKIRTKQGWTSMFITKASVILKDELQQLQSKMTFGASMAAKTNNELEEDMMGLELTMATPELPTLSPEELEEEKIRTSLHQCQDIENVDVTELVYSHSDYPMVLPTILKMINLQ